MIQNLSFILVCITLLLLSWIDYKSLRLPDIITLPLMTYGLSMNGLGLLSWTTWDASLLGAILGWGSLYTLNALYKKIKGVNGIGMGDAKLLGALGALLGWQSLPFIVLIASTSGLLGGYILLKIQHKDWHQPIPFGPFIAIGGISILIYQWFVIN